MTIGITGATGQLGRLVVGNLKSKVDPQSIVALVRSPEKAADLGVAVREADYTKPDALRAALQGIDTLVLISSSEIGQRLAQHTNVIHAAKQAGVKRIVYTSLLRADTSTIDLAEEHKATEAVLKESGIPATILRNGWYTENYTGSLGGVLAGGAVLGSAGEGKISAAARADYAAAVVVAALDASHAGKTYELAGDTAFTLGTYAAEVARLSGKPVAFRNLAPAEYAAVLKQFGLPDGLAQTIAGWDAEAERGALHDDGRQLSRLIGRPTTPLAASIADALAKLPA